MVVLVDASTLRRVTDPIKLYENQITDLAYGLGGAVLVSGGGFATGVKLTEVPSGRLIKEFKGVGSFPLQPLAVSHNGKLLATGSPEQRVRLWDMASGQLLAANEQKVRVLHSVTFSPDDKLLAFADELGSIFLWDLTGQRSLRKLPGHPAPVHGLAFAQDGRTLASASMDQTIKLWHLDSEQEVATLTGHTGWLWRVAFAEHGNALVSASRDGTVKLWRAWSFEQIEAKEKIGRVVR